MGTGLFPDAVLTINCDEEISIKPSFKKSRNFAKKIIRVLMHIF